MNTTENHVNQQLIDERIVWSILLVLLAIVSCGPSEERADYTGITGVIENLPQLPDPYEYSIWMYENANERQMTTFNTDADGLFRLAAAPQSQFIEDMKEVLVSIEDSSERYVKPSGSVVLGARFSSRDDSNFKTYPVTGDFFNTTGSFRIKSNDQEIGSTILFVNDESQSTISLPSLNSGWIYEVWVEGNGEYRSVERAMDLSQSTGLEYEGDIVGKAVMISIEPVDDYSVEPTGMFVLSRVVESTDDLQEMELQAAGLPVGRISKEK